MPPVLDLDVRPDWAEVQAVRVTALDFLRRELADEDDAQAVAMTACELVENAVKYGDFSAPGARVTLQLQIEERAVAVEVRSPSSSDQAAHLARLDRMIQWIRGFQDPFEAFALRLKTVSAQRLDDRESGLGLVRIAYEGRAILDFFLDRDQTVSISAVYPRGGGRPPAHCDERDHVQP